MNALTKGQNKGMSVLENQSKCTVKLIYLAETYFFCNINIGDYINNSQSMNTPTFDFK